MSEDIVRPHITPRRAELRVATLFLTAVSAAVVIVLALPGNPARSALLDSPTLLAPVHAMLNEECRGCLSSILKANEPWAADPSFDPKHALMCVSASCKATLSSSPYSHTEELSVLPAGKAAERTKMMALLAKEQERLDVEQLELNWNRARVFSQFMGPPGKSNKMVLADWVPPIDIDPQGRAVPAWLKFVPAGAPGTSGLFGFNGVREYKEGGAIYNQAWDPSANSQEYTMISLANGTNCYAHESCGACLSGGCAWCGGSDICGSGCPDLENVKPVSPFFGLCPASVAAEKQQEDAKLLNDLVRLSKDSETGDKLVKDIKSEEKKYVKATEVFVNAEKITFYPLAKDPFPNDAGLGDKPNDEGHDSVPPHFYPAAQTQTQTDTNADTSTQRNTGKITFYPLAKDPFPNDAGLGDKPNDEGHDSSPPHFYAAMHQAINREAARNGGQISLAAALAPLNDEQQHINSKRQMLFFRTEVGIAPGQEADIYEPTVGGGGEYDTWAKPTTTWSLIGRPAPGWLHWGNDNDGGYFNPVGGTEWDPQMLNPADNKGTYGPAVNAYRERHPEPAEEPSIDLVGSPLGMQ
jgi:hypothetical protein